MEEEERGEIMKKLGSAYITATASAEGIEELKKLCKKMSSQLRELDETIEEINNTEIGITLTTSDGQKSYIADRCRHPYVRRILRRMKGN